MLSRLLGFIRDLLTAQIFGASFVADAFFVAFRIPNLLRSFIAEGALTNAFVPVFTGELLKGHDKAASTIRSVTSLLLIVTVSLTVLGIFYAKELVSVIAPGFNSNPDKTELCIYLTQIMLPFIICVSIVAMLNGALNSVQVFGASARAQVFMNLCLIAGALLAKSFTTTTGIYILSWSVIVGGIIQIIVQFPALKVAGFSILPSTKVLTPATKQIMLLMAPAVLGSTVYQLQIFLNTVLASLLPEGSISWLFYADRLVQLPIGIITVALGSVLLPTLSRASAEENHEEFSKSLLNSLRYSSFILIPIIGTTAYFAHPLVQLLFERGAFTHFSTEKTAFAIQCYSVGILAHGCSSILARAKIADKDTITPTLIGVVTLFSTLVFSLILMGDPTKVDSSWLYTAVISFRSNLPLVNGYFNLAHGGLALGSALAVFVSFYIYILLLSRRKQIAWGPFVESTIKSLLAFGSATICTRFILLEFSHYLYVLAVGLPSICILFLFFSYIFRSKEVLETFSLLISQLRKRFPSFFYPR